MGTEFRDEMIKSVLEMESDDITMCMYLMPLN